MAKHKVVMNGVEYEVDIVVEEKIHEVRFSNFVAYVKHSRSKPGTSYIGYYNADKLAHRREGPALIYSDGYEGYWLDGKPLTKREWLARTSKLGEVLYGRV